MAQTVASHAVAAFTDPQNGQSPVDADQVTANDNALRVGYVAHDADTGIHLQSSALGSRPAFGTAGRKWLSADASSYRLWFDTGSAWEELTYLRLDAGGTVAGNITVSSGGITVTGDSTISGAITLQSNATGGATTVYIGRSFSTANTTLNVRAGSGYEASVTLATNAGTQRWRVYKETSADNLKFDPSNDGGTTIDTVLTMVRAAGSPATWGRYVIYPAATTSIPSLRIPHGTAPSSPTDGDMWTTTSGLFVRINGSTVGPLS